MSEHRKPGSGLFTERSRGYIYRVLVGLGALAVAYGYLEESEVASLLGFVTQILGVAGNGLAAANTPVKKDAAP